MIEYEQAKDRVVITLTGGSDIFRFAVNMLDDQTEYCEVGRAILVEQRERIGATRFDEWALSILGERAFNRIVSYLERDRHCTVCDGRVYSPSARLRLPMGRVVCKACAA